MSTLTTPTAPVVNKSASQVTELHNYLLKIADSDAPYPNPIGDAEPLISFNGYYALNDTGSFLTIDTNLLVKNGKETPHVTLIYSADGASSELYHLTGPDRAFESVSWRGTTLTATSSNSDVPSFTLDFTRKNNGNEVTAIFQGAIIIKGKTPLAIIGKTYNNPIPMAMYAGAYFEDKGKGAKILEIGTDNTLQYNYNNIGGSGVSMKNVDVFIYNLNMYVFSFNNPVDASMNYSIIMGTSAKGGMVCNDLFSMKKPSISIPRSLQTVTQTPVIKPVNGTNAKSEELAKFAGFYRLTSSSQVFDNAFISIEGQYKTKKDGTTDHTVTLGVSLDGTSSTVYTFDSTMTFEGNVNGGVLTIPITDPIGGNLTINFTREYESAYTNAGSYYGSIVSISGSHNVANFTGETLLNVVPLMAFSGVPLIIAAGSSDSIVIKSKSEVEYQGKSYTDLTVVPLMYIVGFIDDNGHEVIFSLGTDGGKGNTCLTSVFDVKTVDGKKVAKKLPNSIKLYTAIPDGQSGQPTH